MMYPLIDGQLCRLRRINSSLRRHGEGYIRMQFMSSGTANRREQHRDTVADESQERITGGELLVGLRGRINLIGIEQWKRRLRNALGESDLVGSNHTHTGGGDKCEANHFAALPHQRVIGRSQLEAELRRFRRFE